MSDLHRITESGQTSTVVETTQISTPNPSAGSSSSGSKKSSDSHTGAIVGGVVGGIVALAALVLLAWYLRRRRAQDDFDGNFDPDRVVQRNSTIGHGGAGAAGDLLGGAEVTPYTYGGPGGGGGGGMAQHGGSGASYLGPAAAVVGAGAAYAAAHDRDQKGGRVLSHPSTSDGGHSYGYPAGVSPYGAPPPGAGQGAYYHDPSETGSASGSASNGPHTSPSTSSGGAGGYAYGASPYPPLGMGAAAMYYDAQNQGAHGHPSPGPSLPTTGGTSTGSATPPPPVFLSAKEREAYAARYAQQQPGQGPAFPEPHAQAPQGAYGGYGYGASGAPLTLRNAADGDAGAAGSRVVVHQDGGRVPVSQTHVDEEEPPTEIPPTYDSIRSDEGH